MGFDGRRRQAMKGGRDDGRGRPIACDGRIRGGTEGILSTYLMKVVCSNA